MARIYPIILFLLLPLRPWVRTVGTTFHHVGQPPERIYLTSFDWGIVLSGKEDTSTRIDAPLRVHVGLHMVRWRWILLHQYQLMIKISIAERLTCGVLPSSFSLGWVMGLTVKNKVFSTDCLRVVNHNAKRLWFSLGGLVWLPVLRLLDRCCLWLFVIESTTRETIFSIYIYNFIYSFLTTRVFTCRDKNGSSSRIRNG